MINAESPEMLLKFCVEMLGKNSSEISFAERCANHCPKELYQICPYTHSHSLYDSKKLFEIIFIHNRKEKLKKLLA